MVLAKDNRQRIPYSNPGRSYTRKPTPATLQFFIRRQVVEARLCEDRKHQA
jgi:hypothetical protein